MEENNKSKKILRHKLVSKKETNILSPNEVTDKVSDNGFKIYNDGKSKLPATIFFIIVLLLGGYIIKDQFYTTKVDEDFVRRVHEETKLSKIDISKKYIYTYDENEILYDTENDISYKESKIVINTTLTSLKLLEEKINNYVIQNEKTYVYTTNANYSKYTSKYNSDMKYLSQFNYDEIELYETEKYASIVLIEHTIDFKDNRVNNIETYVIDLSDGTTYQDDEILSLFGTNKGEVEENITDNQIDLEECDYFVSSNKIGIIYKTSDNSMGYSSFLTNISKK